VLSAWRQAWGPLGGDGAAVLLFGVWSLAVCDARQAVWNPILPNGV